MQHIILLLVRLVSIIITLMELLIVVRALLSWFPVNDDSPLVNFLYFITEPLLAPIRALLELIPALRDMPIDISSMIAIVFLTLLSALLPEVRF